MDKKFYVLFAFVALIVIVGTLMAINSNRSAQKLENSLKCKLENGETGMCAKREMCSDSTLHIKVRFESDDEDVEECGGDDNDIICCVIHASAVSEKL
jgi:hypothetical protein